MARTTVGSALLLAPLLVLHALLVVNHREPGYLDSVKAFAGESGVDVIMEMAAHTNLSADLDLLKKVR